MNHWGNQKLPIDKRKWKHNQPKPMGHSRSSSKMEVYSNKRYLRKQKNKKQKTPSNKQPNITTKPTRERRTNKTQN